MVPKRIPWWVILFWLAVWQVGSMVVGYSILLPSPYLTLTKLIALCGRASFWLSIGTSLWRITLGFGIAVVSGVVAAALAHRYKCFAQLIAPVILVFKSVPVASFIILILIWFSSKQLSTIISMIMVLPIIYGNVLTAIGQLDASLDEMATVFAISPYAKVRYVLLPQVIPYFRSACLVGLGLAFKAGIAAEIIGTPKNSIGEHLYSAKLYLDTPNLFAWTVAIVILIFSYEKLCAYVIQLFCTRLEKVRWK